MENKKHNKTQYSISYVIRYGNEDDQKCYNPIVCFLNDYKVIKKIYDEFKLSEDDLEDIYEYYDHGIVTLELYKIVGDDHIIIKQKVLLKFVTKLKYNMFFKETIYKRKKK